MRKWSTESVSQHLDFSCRGVFGPPNKALVQLQLEGVSRICNILRRNQGIAYLADEVGLGKTMQALGVISCILGDHPNARVLIIAPREGVQNGWENEAERFNEYVASQAIPAVSRYDNLRSWLREFAQGPSVSLLRHPSFSRPVFKADLPWQTATEGLDLPNIKFRADVPTTVATRSWDFNVAFANDVNKWLARQNARFDLVIVDEAQCLRNIDGQQTNTVFKKLFKGQVDRWLFLSATPAHSGVGNIAAVMNEYQGGDKPIRVTGNAEEDAKALRSAVKRYFVRRPRTFTVDDKVVHKRTYRDDDDTKFAFHCQGTLDTLSIALMQKHLVGHLSDGDGFRFRTGYIASFESLEDSLKNRAATKQVDAEENPEAQVSEKSDFVQEGHTGSHENHAPDEGFVSKVSQDFTQQFEMGLPHPKVDAVADHLRKTAWGDGSSAYPGGSKTVVFCRRLSSIRILRERLMKQYLTGIEQRCETTWNFKVDWEAGLQSTNDEITQPISSIEDPHDAVPEDLDSQDENDDLNRLRVAQRQGKWLYKFRSSFNDGQRNALFFELNWFRWLCSIQGVDPVSAANAIPDDLWRESAAAATRSDKRYRREQSRYLAWHCLERYPLEIFHLDQTQATALADALRPVLHKADVDLCEVAAQASSGPVNRDDALLLFESIWTRAEADHLLKLPADVEPSSADAVHWRKIVATVLSQYMKLTDVLVDLRCAEQRGHESNTSMLDEFVAWLKTGSTDAARLLQHWREWCEHYRLIFSSAVGSLAPKSSVALARLDSFTFMVSIDPVVAITGGTGGHKLAICQFNMPGMPYAMFGTDTIREGVNLHLFCDRVMHYGLPWTSGDLEQRIGRVDRFFGQIERRLLREKAQAKLAIAYPHLSDTLEARQIENLREQRAKIAEVFEDDITMDRNAGGQFIEVDGAVKHHQV
ncbi:SNF2-related protein [Acidovorax sp. NPDC077693]|uniref:SNF2-related protein n=1 Tax=unclassified Acidovorax TaxID=2684926 RepID=UPI0037C54267